MMQNLVMHRVRNTKGARTSLIASYIQVSQRADLISLTDQQVNQFFLSWGGELNDLPSSFRHDIVKIARPMTF